MIVCIGSHGTGKSTTLEKVRKKYRRVYVDDGYSRPIHKLLNSSECEWGDNEKIQLLINQMHLHKHLQDIKYNHHVIHVRGLVDCIAYTINQPEYKNSPLLHSQVTEMKRVLQKTKKQIHTFLYFPIQFPLVGDEVRPSDEKYQRQIDASLQELISELNLPVLILRGDITSRVQRIIELIK